jgi:hypothetical protein
MSALDSQVVIAQAREAWTAGRAIVDTTLNRIFAERGLVLRLPVASPPFDRTLDECRDTIAGLLPALRLIVPDLKIDPQLRLWTVGYINRPGNAEMVIASDAALADIHTFLRLTPNDAAREHGRWCAEEWEAAIVAPVEAQAAMFAAWFDQLAKG